MKIGLALSGGGVRGAAHIGVLKALEENGIFPHVMSGTSVGSIVAALYSVGYKPDEIREIAIKHTKGLAVDFDVKEIYSFIQSIFTGKMKKIDGLIRGEIIKKLVDGYCKQKGCRLIKDVHLPLAIPAVDINTSKIVMFVSDKKNLPLRSDMEYEDSIDIATAVRASSSYPVVFKPCMVNGKRLVDGGLRYNIPAGILRAMGARNVIAVNLGYVGKANQEVDDVLEIAMQSVDIMAYQISKELVKDANYVLLPEVYDVKLLDVSRIPECVERGYQAAMKAMPYIKRALSY